MRQSMGSTARLVGSAMAAMRWLLVAGVALGRRDAGTPGARQSRIWERHGFTRRSALLSPKRFSAGCGECLDFAGSRNTSGRTDHSRHGKVCYERSTTVLSEFLTRELTESIRPGRSPLLKDAALFAPDAPLGSVPRPPPPARPKPTPSPIPMTPKNFRRF